MKIALLEPYFGGSHARWAEGFQAYSSHDVRLFSLPARFWKWRMHGGAVELAEQYMESNFEADLLLATDMLNLSVFLALTKEKTAQLPTALYFHENQLTYPWSPDDEDVKLQRDNHYAFINYTSALAADRVFFNSEYHESSFLKALPDFLGQFPDFQGKNTLNRIEQKSSVLPLGMELKSMDAHRPLEKTKQKRATLLWNHRWEYDKNPTEFFEALFELQNRGVEFKLIVLGEKTGKYPPIFDEAQARLKDEILHFGYAENRDEYLHWLFQADILPVTSHQDFFGGSVVEAMYADVFPLLPKRLAYPEHLPEAYHNTFFYEGKRDFVNRLQRLIFDVKLPRSMNIRQYVERYDWSELIGVYDTVFSKI